MDIQYPIHQYHYYGIIPMRDSLHPTPPHEGAAAAGAGWAGHGVGGGAPWGGVGWGECLIIILPYRM